MPRYARRDYQVGDYWLSKQARSPAWCRTWYDPVTRQTRRVSLGTADLELAKQALVDWVLVHQNRKQESPERVSLAEVFAPFYERHAAKLNSAYQAKLALSYWLDFHGDATVASALRITEQERFLLWLTKDKSLNPNTAARIIAVGKTGLNWAWKRGMLESVPFIQLPKKQAQEPLGRPLEIEEVGQLLRAAKSPHIRDFILLMIATCARPDAVLDLTYARCDVERRLITLNPKGRQQTKKFRPIVRMPDSMVQRLSTQPERATCDYVIQYKAAPVRSVKKAWRQLRKNAGLDMSVNPYSLRHTMARWLRARGVPAWEVAAQLGHKQRGFSTTEIYAPFDPAYLKNAVAAVDEFIAQVRTTDTA